MEKINQISYYGPNANKKLPLIRDTECEELVDDPVDIIVENERFKCASYVLGSGLCCKICNDGGDNDVYSYISAVENGSDKVYLCNECYQNYVGNSLNPSTITNKLFCDAI